jgi:dihydrofolate synthase/folylpolyglutamate synthase
MLAGRDRLRRLLNKAGNPHLAVPSVLVGGTNGKGSVVAALSRVLSTRYVTGAFLKPHLKSIRERWRINDIDVDADLFIRNAHRTCDLIDNHGEPISFFEANVLLGALLFEEARCDIAIWEIGLGGREDACNLVDPLLSILVNVGYDHQAILGNTLAEIARDKAYICRPDHPLILGPPRPGWETPYAEIQLAVAEISAMQGAQLVEVVAPSSSAWSDYFSNSSQKLTPDTLAVIHTSLQYLAAHAFPLEPVELEHALADVRIRGRLERCELRGHPVLLDAAHNVDSLRWLVRVLNARDGLQRYPVIFGCQATRDPVLLLRELKPVIQQLIPIEIPVLRPCPVATIVEAATALEITITLPPGYRVGAASRDYQIGSVTELDSPDNSMQWMEAVAHGISLATPEQRTIICGSIYYLGEILRAFE